MTRLIVLICLISVPAFARYEDTVQRGQDYFASREYREVLAERQHAEAVRTAPIENRKLLAATRLMANRFHRGLASPISETWSDDRLRIDRVDFITGDQYDCKGMLSNMADFVFYCVHLTNFNTKTEYMNESYLLKSVKRKR